MAKEDIPPPPEVVPKKRKQVEGLLAVHLAMLLDRDNLTPSERRRLEEEKQRRKDLKPEIHLGFIGSRAGMTPPQKAAVQAFLLELKPTSVCYISAPYYTGNSEYNFHRICMKLHHRDEFPIELVMEKFPAGGEQQLIRASTQLVVAVKEKGEIGEQYVRDAINYAKGRKMLLRIIGPDGD